MKRSLRITMLLAIAVLVACGGAEQSSPAEDSGSEAEGSDNAQVVEDTPVEIEVAPLYPEGTLDPSMVTADVPVSAVALFNSFYAWDNQTVLLQGYPFVYYGDSTTIEDELELVAVAGEREILATLTFDEPLGLTIPSNELVTASGIIDYSWTGRIELVEGAIVTDAPVAEEIVFSPHTYDGTSPIVIQEFFDIFSVWIGMEVTVDGYYSSTTTSVLDSGDIVRIDLSDPETRSKCVACEMASDVPEATNTVMGENRPGTQIRGTIAGESFNIVGLEGCVLVNR
ncbi:MAG: hypothetical protein KAH54_01575 [Candidatus Sabulitectum sp.]|nr:hypothetical protein [Candidatus Sabulitectum sp.]